MHRLLIALTFFCYTHIHGCAQDAPAKPTLSQLVKQHSAEPSAQAVVTSFSEAQKSLFEGALRLLPAPAGMASSSSAACVYDPTIASDATAYASRLDQAHRAWLFHVASKLKVKPLSKACAQACIEHASILLLAKPLAQKVKHQLKKHHLSALDVRFVARFNAIKLAKEPHITPRIPASLNSHYPLSSEKAFTTRDGFKTAYHEATSIRATIEGPSKISFTNERTGESQSYELDDYALLSFPSLSPSGTKCIIYWAKTTEPDLHYKAVILDTHTGRVLCEYPYISKVHDTFRSCAQTRAWIDRGEATQELRGIEWSENEESVYIYCCRAREEPVYTLRTSGKSKLKELSSTDLWLMHKNLKVKRTT